MSKIREFVFNLPLFDTHEHQAGYGQEWNKKDFTDFIGGYGWTDIAVSKGLDHDKETEFFECWQYVRTTGYGQAANFATKKLFDLDFSKENSEKITEAIKSFVKNKSSEEIYAELYKIANINTAILDCAGPNMPEADYFTQKLHPGFFKKVLRYGSNILNVSDVSTLKKFEKRFNKSFKTLCDLDSFLDEFTETAYKTGNLVGLKIAVAYARNLTFEDVCFDDANAVFDDILNEKKVDAKPLSDYLIHNIFKRAEKLNLPVQIHTGFLARCWQDVRGTNPAQLIPVFQKYKNVKFDVFHAGWPFSEILGSIGKSFPNVWLDMCWAWAMNPVQMERILDEWLSCVPCSKIFAFGADTWSPFSALGYAEQARNGIANVLEKKMRSNEYDLETAKFVAERIMNKNAEEFFNISKK